MCQNVVSVREIYMPVLLQYLGYSMIDIVKSLNKGDCILAVRHDILTYVGYGPLCVLFVGCLLNGITDDETYYLNIGLWRADTKRFIISF